MQFATPCQLNARIESRTIEGGNPNRKKVLINRECDGSVDGDKSNRMLLSANLYDLCNQMSFCQIHHIALKHFIFPHTLESNLLWLGGLNENKIDN